MKRKLYMVLVLLMLGIFLMICPAYADNTIRVYVDKTEIQFDVAPQLYDNRTMVPVRSIFEALGAQVMWNGEAQTVTAIKGDTIVTLVIGDPAIYVNSNRKELSTASFIQQDRTFVPLRAVSEAFNCQVEWNGNENQVLITTKKVEEKKAVNHRGYSVEAPENTLSAYVLSKQKGFTYVEADVQTTADGVPVLLHNPTIDATSNGTGYISKMTYREVSKYDFGSWKSEKYAGEKIPTFDAFMALCKELELRPYIEVAKYVTWTNADAKKLLDIVDRYGMRNEVTWISFSADALKCIRRFDKTARLGLICSGVTDYYIEAAQSLKTGRNEVFLDVQHSGLALDGILACKLAAIPVEVWTVNSEKAIRNLDPYISGVTSDYLNINNYLAE